MNGQWFPLARSEDLVRRHVAQVQLLGQEMALWRDDAGRVNAWENRCPHRGVRLSIGYNMGSELRCQYHAWRYASRSGQCTFIPAHPQHKPASGVRVNVYGCFERYGLVWSGLMSADAQASIPDLEISTWTSLRSTFVEAPLSSVNEYLGARFARRDEFILLADAVEPDVSTRTVLLLQPVNERQTLIHALACQEFSLPQRLQIQRRHTSRFNLIRDGIEAV